MLLEVLHGGILLIFGTVDVLSGRPGQSVSPVEAVGGVVEPEASQLLYHATQLWSLWHAHVHIIEIAPHHLLWCGALLCVEISNGSLDYCAPWTENVVKLAALLFLVSWIAPDSGAV